MSDFSLNASARDLVGKGASRRLRRLNNEIPAIVYGNEKAPQNISILHKDIMYQLENEAFYNSIINLVVDGTGEQVILKDLQRHPAKPIVMHADFLRVDANTAITVNIPLHFINAEQCKGVKMEGGSLSMIANSVEVSCLPKDMPEFLEVDVIDMDMGDILHLSDIVLPEGVTIEALALDEDHNQPIASIIKPRGEAVEDEEDEAAEGEEAAEDADSEDGDSED